MRRQFLGGLAAAAVACSGRRSVAQESVAVSLDIHEREAGYEIPGDFIGLSYETAQVANPDFFSPADKQLADLFRELTSTGVLRLGGGSSEFTAYDPVGDQLPRPFEVFGPDTSRTVKHGTVNSPLALKNLRGFLDATGWKLIWGLNLGQGTLENAVREAAAVDEIVGSRLIAFQIGNEPDSFRNRYRPANYAPEDFMKEWNSFHAAILAKIPQAKFAGPDISNKVPYFTAFASEAPQHKDVILLTAHSYAMGPAGSPTSTIDSLLDGNPKLETQPDDKLDVILAAARNVGLSYRMSEGNSCWDGGKAGVSDTLASALWCIDYMLNLAQRGVSGVNFHGGGNGFYTPIAGAPSTGFMKRPEYFGIQFMRPLLGSRFLQTTPTGAGTRVSAYALRSANRDRLVIINKEDSPIVIKTSVTPKTSAMLLTGAALDSKGPIVVKEIPVARENTLMVPTHSAVSYRL